jgi:hypothetical protein
VNTSTLHPSRAVTSSGAFERLARGGYVARGIIYILIGVLAVQLARGVGGDQPSQEGAMHAIARQSFGAVLLALVVVGLAAYTILRLAQAIIGRTPEAGRHSALDRVAATGSAVAYGIFCAMAIAILAGSAGSGGGKPQAATADVLGWPAGRALVAIAGVVFIVVAAYQAHLALSRRFLKDSKTMYMSRQTLRNFSALGVVGLLARTVTFGLIGIFLVKAAVEYDPSEAVGVDGALQSITTHAYGTVALGVVAAGLIAFGLYSIGDARFRKI